MIKDIKTIDEYISNYPAEVRKILTKLRQEIKKNAPHATETIGYGIPTFKLNGNLVHFGAYAHHIGFYPGPGAIEEFQKELKEYKCSTGAIQFPLDKPLPYDLVTKIVRFRVKINEAKKK